MKKLSISILFFCFLIPNTKAQTFTSQDPNYIINVKSGEAALKAEKFDSCMVYYRKGFKIKQTSVLSTLRMAACAYSGGYLHEYKKQMNKAIELDWGSATNIFDNFDEFSYLKDSPFSKTLHEKSSQAAIDLGINIELMNELEQIGILDQEQRRHMRDYEWGTPPMDSLWKLQNYSDSVNTIRIEEIIAEHGYPGKSLVGGRQKGTAFLVIQHAELVTQEKYLPLMKAAAEAGEVNWSSIALLIDRVNLRKGGKQIYGSQIGTSSEGNPYLLPLEDPENVNKKREEVGLGPIDDYTGRWDFKFDLEEHKVIWAKEAALKAEKEKDK